MIKVNCDAVTVVGYIAEGGASRGVNPDDPRTRYVPKVLHASRADPTNLTRITSAGWGEMWREAEWRADGWFIRGNDFGPPWNGDWQGPVSLARAEAFCGQVQAAHRRACAAWERAHGQQ